MVVVIDGRRTAFLVALAGLAHSRGAVEQGAGRRADRSSRRRLKRPRGIPLLQLGQSHVVVALVHRNGLRIVCAVEDTERARLAARGAKREGVRVDLCGVAWRGVAAGEEDRRGKEQGRPTREGEKDRGSGKGWGLILI